MLSLKNFSTNIGAKQILKNINFTFEKGKIYAVMGPNGSGKSTLAYSIMGSPVYEVQEGSKMEINGEDILEMEANERAEKGIFLSFQSPLSLSGVKVYQLLQMALNGKKNPLEIRNKVKEVASELKINEELLGRSLNEGASGGEKKKLEVLQAAVLDKQILIFDEVDTGVDVDALKAISQFLKKHQENKTYIIITHYNRILHYLKPDYVLVIANGELKKVGDYTLSEEIEKNGYENVINGA
jgi:Fe-S cluster assembly ATP-binding protein